MSRERPFPITVELSEEQNAAIAAFFSDLSPKQMAAVMAHWSDEEQADVFIELAERSKDWGVVDWESQWYMVGRHLRTCKCTTTDAQNLVDAIYRGLTAPLRPWEREKMEKAGLDPDACDLPPPSGS